MSDGSSDVPMDVSITAPSPLDSAVSVTTLPAIRLVQVGKLYKLYSSPLDAMLGLTGLDKLFRRDVQFKEYWALRGVDLEIPKGSRMGIVGQNGAGKSTMLKLISGNFAATEGKVEVQGQVQALMTSGAGFHPEFTGRENVRASLVYQGLSKEAIEDAIAEITEFTELGQFMDQAFKTYSAGMQARLTFATATAIKPEVLIVDEVLGAGDGYFIAKASERMQRLIEASGATVLIVSHGLDQITRFCTRAIWMERGQVAAEGPALEIVKAYDQHLRVLNERRIRAKTKAITSDTTPNARFGFYGDTLAVRTILTGAAGATCAVSSITLFEDGHVYETLNLGAPQDSNINQAAFLQADKRSPWGRPVSAENRRFRTLTVGNNAPQVTGQATFSLYAFNDAAGYRLEIAYQAAVGQRLQVEVWKNDTLVQQQVLPTTTAEWQTQQIDLATGSFSTESSAGLLSKVSGELVRKWPAEGSLVITDVVLRGQDNRDQRSFEVGSPLQMHVAFEAKHAGTYLVTPVTVLYRLDGIVVTKHIGEPISDLTLEQGERREFVLDLGNLNLGNGNYVFSLTLYKHLDLYNPEWYDVIDRSFEFEVYGTPTLHSAIFQHPGTWQIKPK